jgi:hypothetical protein
MVERRIETAVVKSVSGSDSLRTTVPQAVATMMGLGPGDHMVWVINPQAGTIEVTMISKADLEPLQSGAVSAKVQQRPADVPIGGKAKRD